MNKPRVVEAASLREAGREPATPFCLALEDNSDVVVSRLLRVLPGKRIVGEAQWQGRRVLAKLFVADHAERHWASEKSGIEALLRAQVPTPELLLATTLAGGGYVLLTRFLDDAQSLAQAWLPVAGLPPGHPDAVAVLHPAFAMLGKLHAAGLVHADLHLGNFLLGEGRCWVVDGDAVRATASAPAATENLALLLAQLPSGWDAFRDELLRSYFSAGGCEIADPKLLERELERARNWRLNDFLKKTLRDCSLFAVTHRPSSFVAVRRDEQQHLQPLLDGLDQAVTGGQLLKDGHTSTVARVALAEHSLVVKRYNLKNALHALSRAWRPSRAWHSWREGHRLSFFGIATPSPLALVEERLGPLRRRAFLINEFCPGPDLLTLLAPDRVPEDAMATAIVALFAALHRLKISHGDLKATNLLWHAGKVVVIDLDALRQHRSIVNHARAWRRDRARLLRNWPADSVLHAWLDRQLPVADA
ncbi:MAG: lipopolysaccharide kinase InaA family protein [Propionivibrio sp.]